MFPKKPMRICNFTHQSVLFFIQQQTEDPNRLSFEQYLLYKMVQGKSDLIYGIIMHICTACSFSEEVKYTTNPDDIMAGWKQSRHCDSLRVIQVKTENN